MIADGCQPHQALNIPNRTRTLVASRDRSGTPFFETLSIPLLAGRTFGSEDTAASPDVAVFNESFVRLFGLGSEALGKRFAATGRDERIEIVGVVADAAYHDVKSAIPPQVFRPRTQAANLGELGFYVRSAIDPDVCGECCRASSRKSIRCCP